MRYLSLISVLSAVDDCQLSPSGRSRVLYCCKPNQRQDVVEPPEVALRNNKIYPFKCTLCFKHFATFHRLFLWPYIPSTVQHLYSHNRNVVSKENASWERCKVPKCSVKKSSSCLCSDQTLYFKPKHDQTWTWQKKNLCDWESYSSLCVKDM